MTVQSDKFFCFGFGYVAGHLARAVLPSGATVFGTSRSTRGAQRVSILGARAHGRLFETGQAIDVPKNCHWIISIPPDEMGCPAFRSAYRFARSAASITYLSTTGVYGDRDGDWVFENSAVDPQSERAKNRVMAEAQWKQYRANIVRLPGIYGPGRSAFDRIRAGTAQRIVKPGQVFSRVHVDDIVSGLRQITRWNLDRYVFHLCDDEPAPPQDVIAHAAELLGTPPPPEVPFECAELSKIARSFYSECKRVSNTATKLTLKWEPKYPTYREGLAAILSAEGNR